MKMLWCWRCRIDVPMLEAEEFQSIWSLYSDCVRVAKGLRQQQGSPLEGCSLREWFVPVLKEYERLTGFAETNPNAVLHHRVSIYGPPCAACGKPLRTPKARHCAACGAAR